MHGHRAGVSGAAGQFDPQARKAVDRSDKPQRQAEGLEHRPLFDMQFDVGVDVEFLFGGVAYHRRIEPKIAQGLRQRGAIPIA